MGVIKENYKIENQNGVIAPVAYGAIISFEHIEKDLWRANFGIASSRENVISKKYFDTLFVDFEWDRKSNPIPLAYEKAKETKKEYDYFNKNGPVYKNIAGIFEDWQDDIKG